MPEPLTLALLAGAGLAFAGGRVPSTHSPIGWVWPMPILPDGRPPVVSDGWGSKRDGGARQHRGVDVMYRRNEAVARPADHGSKLFEVPVGAPILAARRGRVWSVGQTERGIGVVIDHGKPYATFYQHLASHKVAKGQPVEAGEIIGTCGFSGIDSQSIRHLHFEVWAGGGGASAIDPEPLMRQWMKMRVVQ